MADMNELYSALLKADAAGDTESAKVLADYIRSQPVAPAQSPISAVGSGIADFAKMLGGSAIRGTAGAPSGLETGIKGLARQSMEGKPEMVMPASVYQPGLDTEEDLFGQETEQQKAQRNLNAQRAVASMPSIPGAKYLAQIGRDAQKSIEETLTPETKKALQESQLTGNIFKGDLDFGTNPSVRGYAMQTASVFGSMAPVVAASIATRNPLVGGVLGAGMAADEAAVSAAEFIAKKSHDQLMAESPFYAQMISGGASPKEARDLTVKKAAETGAALQGIVAMGGDTFTGKLVTGAFEKLLTKVAGPSMLGKTAAGIGLSSAEQGLSETAEGVASDIGIASVVPSKEIGEESAANLILGALGGVGPGSLSGLAGKQPPEEDKTKNIMSLLQKAEDERLKQAQADADAKIAAAQAAAQQPEPRPEDGLVALIAAQAAQQAQQPAPEPAPEPAAAEPETEEGPAQDLEAMLRELSGETAKIEGQRGPVTTEDLTKLIQPVEEETPVEAKKPEPLKQVTVAPVVEKQQPTPAAVTTAPAAPKAEAPIVTKGPASRAPNVTDLKTYTPAEAKAEWERSSPGRRSATLSRLEDDALTDSLKSKSWDEMSKEERKLVKSAMDEDFFTPVWYTNKEGRNVPIIAPPKVQEKTQEQQDFERGQELWDSMGQKQKFDALLGAGIGKDADQGQYAKWADLGPQVRERVLNQQPATTTTAEDLRMVDEMQRKNQLGKYAPQPTAEKVLAAAEKIQANKVADEQSVGWMIGQGFATREPGKKPHMTSAGKRFASELSKRVDELTEEQIINGSEDSRIVREAADKAKTVAKQQKEKAIAQRETKEATVAKEAEDKAKAKQDLEDALGDLSMLLTKSGRMNIVPEQEQQLLPILTKIMDAAFRLGHIKFKEAARFVIDTIRARLGDDVADQISIDHLQGAYIGMAGKYQDQGASSKQDVVSVDSIEDLGAPVEVEAAPAVAGKLDINKPDQKFELAQKISQHFLDGGKFATINEARAMISELTGQDVKAGTQIAKQADEAIEVGVVLAAQNIIKDGRTNDLSKQEIYDQLVDLYERQPNLAVRSSTSVEEQAYSTPAPLAFVASELAGISRNTGVYEPTAGNGMLLIGSTPSRVVANEINPDRRAMLEKVLNNSEEVYGADAAVEYPSAFGIDARSINVVIANPPFGVTKYKDGTPRTFEVDGFSTREIDQAIALRALTGMEEDGKAVLIVGGVNSKTEDGRREGYRGRAKREFYAELYSKYNVVDHFTAAGSMYTKQGASYPVDIIVIDGIGPAARELPAADLPQVITSYEQLKEKLNDRMVSGEAVRPSGANVGAGEAGAGEPERLGERAGRPSVEPGTEGREPAGVGERGVQAAEPAAGGQREPTGGRAGEEQPGAANVPERKPAGEPVAGTGEAKRGREAGAKERGPAELGGVSVVSGERVQSGLKNRAGEETETATQVTYNPHSQANSVGTLVPKAMADAIEESLARIESQVGNLDEYVGESLEMDPETVRELFSAEQVDALALAINNAEAGKGFIIGDQTGVGKGRVVAAMIRYALVHGKVPIFVTEKPNLYSDMIRDLDDIGMTNELALDTAKPKILITNSSEAIPYTLLRTEKGEITENNLTLKAPHTGAKLDNLLRDLQKNDSLGQYKVIFTTYSQLQNVKGKGTERQNFIKHFGAGNYMIFDESHNAGGAGAEPTKAEKDANINAVQGRAGFVRSLVQNAYGTFFSSATYAKRPDVMDLYSSTDMRLAVDKLADLSDAIKAGGIPMQQTVAQMLTQVGQYIRRERTFAGVSYETQETKVDKDTAENMATSMRDILAFSRAKEVVVKGLQKELDKQGARAGMEGEKTTVQQANFGSIMHNLIDQMLLSLKAQDSVRHAIERLKAGEKVVMTVSNTMGSFLQSYADEMGLATGDAVNLSFSDLYKRYLEKQRIIRIRKPGGKTEQYRLTDEDLGPALVAQYAKIANFIDNAGFGSAPISPIDYMHAELRKAGYKTEEITGRTVTLNYESGKPLLTSRSANIKQRVNAVKAFNSGAADVIILNQAGSTGLSLHASNKVKDQRKRHMIIVQPEKNIDTHMQMLGRVHRTGQVIPPAYSQMMADIPAEMRPAAVLLKKMASLNANTTASRKSAVSAEGAVDFMNDYGGQVAQEYLRDNPDVYESLGGNKIVQIKDDPTESDEADIRRLTGYIPILPIKQQEEIYKDIVDRYNDLIEREDSMGTNKLESKPMDLDAQTVSEQQITESKGEQSVFAKPAMMERVDIKRTVKPYSKAEVQDMVSENRVKYDQNPQYKFDAIDTKARAYADKQTGELLAKEADPVRVANMQQQLQSQLTHVRTVLSNYQIGTPISVKNNNGVFVYGVVTNIEQKGKTKNPLAGSDWKMTIALANGDAKSINLTFSQIGSTYQLKPEPEINYLDPETLKGEYIPLYDLFDKGATVRREKRWMVTGNILAGFAAVNNMGQIMTYTKDDGTTAQGVLMPRTFDFEKQQKNAPVKLNSVAKVMAFFNDFGDGAEVATQGGALKIQNRGNGRYRFLTSSSKREGGTFFLDNELRKIVGEFYKSGQTMSTMIYDKDAMERAAQYLIADRGETLVANNHKEEARKAFQAPLANVQVNREQQTLNPEIMSKMDREEMISRLQSARQRRGAIVTKFMKGEAGLAEQAQLTELTEIANSLKDAIKSTKPERREPKNFFRDATDRWEEGNLSDAVYDVISDVYHKYPFVLQGLKLSVRQAPDDSNASGAYRPLARFVYLYKNTTGVENPVTIRHELMHSLEQMMPEEAVIAVIEEWHKKLEQAIKTDKSPGAKRFFEAVINFFDSPNEFTYQEAIDAMPSYEYYQYVNPSEYWAVNAEPLMARKLGSGWDKFVLAVKRLYESVKNVFGFDNKLAVHKAFNEVMSGKHQRIGSAALVNYVTDQKIELENQNTKRNYKGQPAPLATWTDEPTTTATDWQQRLQDKHVDTKNVVKAINKEIGQVKDMHDPYMMETLYHGRVKEQTTNVWEHQIDPLLDKMIELKVSRDEIEEYLHNRVAESRNENIAARNPQMPDGGSGIFTDEARAYLAELDQHPEKKKKFETLAKMVDDIIFGIQEHLVETGQESRETIERWRAENPNYVPLNRDPDELDFVNPGTGLGRGFGTGGSFTRAATGSLATVDSILGSVALMAERAIIRGEKARVGRALYGLVISSPNPNFWMAINPDAIKSKKKLIAELVSLGLSKDDADNILQEPRTPSIDKETGLVQYRVNPSLRKSPNVFPIRINGKDRFIIFNPGNPVALRMAKALNNLDANGLSEGLGLLAEATRLMAMMNTQYNIVFGMWNFARDVGEAHVNLSNTPIADKRNEVIQNSIPAVRALYRSLRGKPATTPEMQKWMDWNARFQKAGGEAGISEQFSKSNERAKMIEEELAKRGNTGWRHARDVTLRWMADFNDAAENAVRLAAFRAAVEAGMSDDRAAELSKNLTVNFNRKGAWTTNINAFYAFWNARIQGAARVVDTLTEEDSKGNKRLSSLGKKIIRGGMLIGVLQAFALMVAGFDDDEPPEFIKDKNFIIPLFGTKGKYLAIPMPPGYSALPATGRILGEYAFSGFKEPGKRLSHIASVVLDAFNPLGSSDFAQTIAPTIFDPFVGVLSTNRDAFGRPISREARPNAPTPGYERSRENASTFGKAMAYGINYITGGGAHDIGKWSPTGDDIDYLIAQYSGGAAREVMKAGRFAAALFQPEDIPSYRVPLVGKLYGETGSPAAVTDQFYKNVNMLAEREGTLKRMTEKKLSTTAYRAEHPETSLISTANNLENQISKLNKTRRELLAKPQTAEVKAEIKRLEEQKTRQMKDFNERVKKIEQR